MIYYDDNIKETNNIVEFSIYLLFKIISLKS